MGSPYYNAYLGLTSNNRSKRNILQYVQNTMRCLAFLHRLLLAIHVLYIITGSALKFPMNLRKQTSSRFETPHETASTFNVALL